MFLIFISISVIGQNNENLSIVNEATSIIEEFEHAGRIPEGWMISNTGCFIDVVSRQSGEYGIGLKENGYITSPELPGGADIGKVVFWYSKAQTGDDYRIVIGYESLETNSNREWHFLMKINPKTSTPISSAQSNIFEREEISLRVIGAKKLKFSVEGNVANTLYLDGVKITALTDAQKQIIEEERRNQATIALLKNIMEDRENNAYRQNLVAQIDRLKDNYIKGFEILLEISDKLNQMSAITQLGLYMSRRVDAANPTKYGDYNTIISEMKTYADDVDKESIDEIEKTIESEIKNNPIKTIGGVGVTIANVITAGRFGNIVSGIKSIFRSIFKSGNSKLGNAGQRRNRLQTAVTNLRKLNVFFKILEEENLIIIQLRSSFEETQKHQTDFEKVVKLFGVRYTNDANSNINIVYDSVSNRDETIREIKVSITDFFTIIKNYVQTASITDIRNIEDSNIKKIEKMSNNVQQVKQYTDSYKGIASEFRSLFYLIDDDLNRQNPFTRYRDNNSGSSFLQSSLEIWETQKRLLQNALAPVDGITLSHRIEELLTTYSF